MFIICLTNVRYKQVTNVRYKQVTRDCMLTTKQEPYHKVTKHVPSA